MAARSADVLDVRAGIVAALRGLPAPGIPDSATPFILVAEDLAPADTATLDPAVVVALATSGGGPQSHTAIIARSLGLPAVVAAAGVDRLPDGTEIYLDGAAGTITTGPGDGERAAAAAWAANASTLASFTGQGRTADGHHIPLLANVGGAKEAVKAAAAGAEGVGLLRTEFCFLERETEPSIAEQVKAYKGVFDAFPGKKVVVRTLDAGADKPLPFLTNDLTQYTMAADRQLGPLAALNNPWQPAVLALVRLTVAGSVAEGSGKLVGVCGEAAADPALAVVLVGLGVSTLSMTARSLAAVAAVLATVTLKEAREIATLALRATSPEEARDRARGKLPILAEPGL